MKLLEQDANQPSGKLADQLSVSASTVRRRMQQLLKDGVIRIVAIPEPKQIGFPSARSKYASGEKVGIVLEGFRREVISRGVSPRAICNSNGFAPFLTSSNSNSSFGCLAGFR